MYDKTFLIIKIKQNDELMTHTNRKIKSKGWSHELTSKHARYIQRSWVTYALIDEMHLIASG